MPRSSTRTPPALLLATMLGLALASPAFAQTAIPLAEVAGQYGVSGGLCVQIGGNAEAAVPLARTGRFLIQVLKRDPGAVTAERSALQEQDLYGLVSVDHLPDPGHLPYAENLVNLLVVAGTDSEVPLAEALRVLTPRGVIVLQAGTNPETLTAAGLSEVRTGPGGQWIAARKPWPAEMDEWTHPRHAADGNAVSADTQAGPPRRVRWVAGPSVEISNLVTAAGRNYYGGAWARDGFNGLRLWQRELKPTPARGGFSFRITPGSIAPVARGDALLAFTDGKLAALDGRTGETICEYPEAGTPGDLLSVEGTLLAVDPAAVRALDAQSAALRWKYEAAAPRYVTANESGVYLLEGPKDQAPAAVALDLATGQVRWRHSEYEWLSLVRRTVCHGDLVAMEVSTLSDTKEGNALHVLAGDDGRLLWSREFVPGMQHMKQARAMFVGDDLWVLENREGVALDPHTGEVRRRIPAGFCHCFPPVATARYLLAGEMELTDLTTGALDANRITKAACGRDGGWVPANGLIYASPKHCVCWPMLRGYVAMAPEAPSGPTVTPAPADFLLETAAEPPTASAEDAADDWPCYRHDAWRSAGTASAVAPDAAVRWIAALGRQPEGTIADDWRENPFVAGPVTPPVVAGGLVYVARPDAHEVVALDGETGAVRWRYTANGRVDTPPTIHRGTCLFGTKSGWVYGLRADDGRLVWRLRVAPGEERIVAYGQLESPWPAPGSVLVIGDEAYVAAGRQPLADGGILVLAFDPASGHVRWSRRLDSVPTTNFYGCSGLEFDNFNLLHREGDAVAMSRWLFRCDDGAMTCKAAEAFAVLGDDAGKVAIPRACWTYAPRHQPRHGGETSTQRPLAAFRGSTLLACLYDFRTVFRRDFQLDAEPFDTHWITGWAASENFSKQTGLVWQSDRLGEKTVWRTRPFDEQANRDIAAMILAGPVLWTAGADGGLTAVSADSGEVLARRDLPPPAWDGMAAARGRLYVTTRQGEVLCLGAK